MSLIAGAIRKAELRTAALNRRDGLDQGFRETASTTIGKRVLPMVLAGRPRVVSGYWPMRSEVDPRGLLADLHRAGIAIALPVILHRKELRFREWQPDRPLVAGGFGTFEPSDEARELVPDVVLLPLAAFDRAGHRIGYGRGHYDKAMSALSGKGIRPVLIGLAFSAQEVPEVPAEPHDVRLDRVVTETAIWEAGKRRDIGQ